MLPPPCFSVWMVFHGDNQGQVSAKHRICTKMLVSSDQRTLHHMFIKSPCLLSNSKCYSKWLGRCCGLSPLFCEHHLPFEMWLALDASELPSNRQKTCYCFVIHCLMLWHIYHEVMFTHSSALTPSFTHASFFSTTFLNIHASPFLLCGWQILCVLSLSSVCCSPQFWL